MPDDSSASKGPEVPPQFTRTVDMLGLEGFERLRRAFVVVVGLGGVGSHAAVALARSGVGRLRLVDFDDVTWSSLNRHAVATPDDVGQLKVEVVGRFVERIHPRLVVEPVDAFFDADSADALLAGEPDVVVDAIDGLTPKVALLRSCVEQGLSVVSSMGAAARSDPSKVRVGPIFESQGCPLARKVRQRLRRLGVTGGITAVYSVEPGRDPLPPDETEARLDRGRVRNRLPSLSTIPGIFGYALASVVIRDLAESAGSAPRNDLPPTAP